jgi:hypothetical protein
MKTTLGALAVALIAGVGAASAMPTIDSSDSTWVHVFDPQN